MNSAAIRVIRDLTGQTGLACLLRSIMSTKWQMQDAKARFAELVRKAGTDGPQVVTHRGVDAAVVLSMDEYKRLQPAKKSFVDHLFSGPKFDDEIVDMLNERSSDTGRDIEF